MFCEMLKTKPKIYYFFLIFAKHLPYIKLYKYKKLEWEAKKHMSFDLILWEKYNYSNKTNSTFISSHS